MKHKKVVGFPKEAQCIVNIPSISTTGVSFASLLATPTPTEEPTSMNNNSERDYMRNRVQEITWDFSRKIELDFGLDQPDYPKTYKELIEWIKKDKFELNEKRTKYIDACMEEGEGDYYDFNSFDGIIWTAIKKDWDGAKAAKDSMHIAKQKALDVIQTQDAVAGLEALREFEAWEYKKNKKN